MQEKGPSAIEPLPTLSDKDLLAINNLMAESKYQIKIPLKFTRVDRSDKLNPDFILYTLNDYLGHLQECVAATKRIFSVLEQNEIIEKLSQKDILAFKLLSVIRGIDIKKLSDLLLDLQKNPKEVTVSHLIPFTRLLFQPLIRIYYMGADGISRKYMTVLSFSLDQQIAREGDILKSYTISAIKEWNYLFDQTFIGMYPLLLRMCSPMMLSQNDLFYKKGSIVLSWLHVLPSEIFIVDDKESVLKEIEKEVPKQLVVSEEMEEKQKIPFEVAEGLKVLERFFPEAGWENLEKMPDLCPYFQPILQFEETFSQLAPENPLQQTIILLWVLEELFQGLRLIHFLPIENQSHSEEGEDIYKILEEWILYLETLFYKVFSADLKEYTHQIYTQPEYNKTPYGRTLLSNMYTLIKTSFLPHFNIRMYGTAKFQKDDRLPPFFIRVSRLKRLLSKYNDSIENSIARSSGNLSGSVPGIQNPWELYKFEIANPVSRRLDALCGGKNSHTRTNAQLIKYTLSILNVLDWWINSKESYAYLNTPDYLYRVTEPGSSVPAFGIKPRTDIESLFLRHLKMHSPGNET